MNPGTAEGSSGKRAWLAVLLSFLVPGVGHLYLREWLRAGFWFLTVLLAGNLLIPMDAVPADGSFVEIITETYRAAPLVAKLALVGLTFLCMLDAYWLATRSRPRSTTGAGSLTCPNCGKEVDEDLDFCHWCSAELTAPERPAEDDLTAGELNERAGAFEGDLTGGPDDDGDEESERK